MAKGFTGLIFDGVETWSLPFNTQQLWTELASTLRACRNNGVSYVCFFA